jgi:hypothetical protein
MMILEKVMPRGVPPLSLFTTMARDERLFGKFFAASLLDTAAPRVDHRSNHRAVWIRVRGGVHMAFLGARAGFSAEQIEALVHGTAKDECWMGVTEGQVLLAFPFYSPQRFY